MGSLGRRIAWLRFLFSRKQGAEQEVGDADDEHVEHHANHDLVHPVLDREERQHEADEGAREGRGDQPHVGVADGRRDDGRGERAGEQLTLDGDVDDARALAQQARETTEHQRDGQQHRGRQQARHVDVGAGLACTRPREQRGHERPPRTDPAAQMGNLRKVCTHHAAYAAMPSAISDRRIAVTLDGNEMTGMVTKSVEAPNANEVLTPDSVPSPNTTSDRSPITPSAMGPPHCLA